MARHSTSAVEIRLAIAELISGGHGLVPVPMPKNSLYPCRVSPAP